MKLSVTKAWITFKTWLKRLRKKRLSNRNKTIRSFRLRKIRKMKLLR